MNILKIEQPSALPNIRLYPDRLYRAAKRKWITICNRMIFYSFFWLPPPSDEAGVICLKIMCKKVPTIGINNTASNIQRIFFMLGERFCLEQYYPKDEEIVYRYMPFYKFENLVSSKELYLSRGDRFDKEDPYEGAETKVGTSLRRTVYDNNAFEENTRLYERNRSCVAINSWYVGDLESREMWEKFAGETDSIAIRTRVEKIRSALLAWDRYLCVRKIEYAENHDEEFTKCGCPFFPFSIKRKKKFDDENELRIIFGEGKGCIAGSPQYKARKIASKGKRISVDPSILIGEIVLSPKSTTAVLEEKVRNIFKNAGLHVPPIVCSSLI